jgi:hypothetical protein
MADAAPVPRARWRTDPGFLATVAIGLALCGLAVSVNVPGASQGFKGDEATYYCLAYSLALDHDFEYRREDLVRVWREYPGPQGIFLKRGRLVVGSRAVAHPPFVELVKGDDPDRGRLYYGKAYIYPLVAAPFVRAFGTNGFLVLHALLLALDFATAYLLLVARGTARHVAVVYALVFFAASIVPLYFVWLSPELFNVSLVMYACFFWAYKEAFGPAAVTGRWNRLLRSRSMDLIAAALVGVATFSKPPHVALMVPLLALPVLRRQWRWATAVAVAFAIVAGGMFVANAAISGDLNYQGGDRKTFYGPPPAQSTYAGPTGFPFAGPTETFDTTGQGKATDQVPLGVLVTSDTFRVFRHNVWYFLVGRHAGFVPYFFPGVLSVVLFLLSPARRGAWQWLALGTAIATAAGMLLYMPYTYSGGGGPIGNRYYIAFYPLFLLLTPPLAGAGSVVVNAVVGGLFVAKLLLNPFVASRNPGDAAKTGPLRLLPIELTTINDLPVAAYADRARLPLGGDPAVRGYFPDDNVFDLEGDRFWVRGRSRAEVILRAPARIDESGRAIPLRISELTVEVSNGGASNRVTVATGRAAELLELPPFETRQVRLVMPYGVPYRPWTYPTNYAYVLSITTTAGFVPYLEQPPSTDARFLGAMIRITPTYVDAR